MIIIYVNPFWFGVLMTLIVEIPAVFIIAYISISINIKKEESNAGYSEESDR